MTRPSAKTTTPVAPFGWDADKGRDSAMGGEAFRHEFAAMSLRHSR